jgi:hypothetical protein
MRLEEMTIKYICRTCEGHFIDSFKIDGNYCKRSSCGSHNIKLISRKGWSDEEIQFILKRINENPLSIAKMLKRPFEGVRRKMHRLKVELRKS